MKPTANPNTRTQPQPSYETHHDPAPACLYPPIDKPGAKCSLKPSAICYALDCEQADLLALHPPMQA